MRNLHAIFEAQAALRPNDAAVVFGERTITYSTLDRRANQLARYLRARGVTRGGAVAMLLPRSIEAYAAMLGILKAGAAYVPIDPAYPGERIAWILADSGACALVTQTELATQCAGFAGPVVCIDAEQSLIAGKSAAPMEGEEAAAPEDLCYLIYTSGSTGRPKGVMVEHRNAVHLVEAEREVFGVRAEDRVYQGASLCFDLSVEEMWLAFAAGATLVGATPDLCRAGPDLSRRLDELGVTVVSCVPTLLAMMDDAELPALRLLIVGGEACPNSLVARWAGAGRRMVNTYGPTETTVIATYADVSPASAVTIGRALPGYRVSVLDDQLRLVAQGEAGEICIAGAGVARGYRGLPEETRARFVEVNGERVYRSGDVGRFDTDGNLEFVGRTDGQVKLRGRRIEPGEIESAMLRDECVRAAVCVVRDEQLVACVVPKNGVVDEAGLRAHLRTWLPAWMMPAVFETYSELPRLTSGKIDYAALMGPRVRPVSATALPTDPLERKLVEIWRALFGTAAISVDDDFFLELGGHSLLAARMVSEARKDERLASLTMRDVYSYPTIALLASVMRERAPEAAPERKARGFDGVQHFVAGAAQTASLYFVFAFRGLQWIAPWLVYFLMARHHSTGESAAWALAMAMAVLPAMIAIAIGAKWIVLGRVRPGRHRLWGFYYLRWWFVQTLVRSLPLTRLGGTPLLPFVYRLFGGRIGENVHIATDLVAAFDVISIGDGASIDEGASLLGYTVENGELVIDAVSVGRECLVGTRSVLCPGASMEDGARLEDLSLVQSGMRIPGGETWAGSPAQRIAGSRAAEPGRPARRNMAALYAALLYVVLVLAFPLVELAAFMPGIALLMRSWLMAPLAGACFILTATAEVVVLKWLLIGRARAGRYPVDGSFYIRNWVVEQLMAFAVDVAGPLHSTIFLKPWYRALGARLGRFVEISTASATTPDLLDVGDDSTIADEVSLGAARVERGWLTLAPTRLGHRTFVGNGAVIPAGTTTGRQSLIGVLTVAPTDSRDGDAWLGSPPMLLKRRQTCNTFLEKTTFRPTRKKQWARGGWEVLRVVSPGAGLVVATVAVIETALRLWDKAGATATLLLLPAIFAAVCAGVMLAVVPVKWVVMGKFRPFETPLWSAYLWRLELVNALFEFMATPIGLETLQGTPMLAWYLRMLGCRIGRGAYIETTGFIEFDLVDVGDRAILNRDCILQTHLYEDRVMKGSGLRVGADCEIGTNSIVLYDAEMKPGARLGALSLVMKGEVLPAGRVWVGSPLDSSTTHEEAVSYQLSAVS
jgi:non-ribosomal peptide synthetase-like protein